MANWTQLAEQAVKDGYQGSSWEGLLRRALERSNPKLVAELGAEFPDYLKVKAHQAVEMYSRLTEEGTDPGTARELALDELLGNGAPREDRLETTRDED